MQARDPLSGITEAEQRIEERKKDRPGNPEERRNMVSLRHLFATYIVRQTPSQPLAIFFDDGPQRWLDREFPHQVAIPEARYAGTADAPHIQIFCNQVNVAPRHHSVRRDDKSYVVYCFADPQHAASFAAIFEGEPFNPSERGRGRSWWQRKKRV